MRFAFADPPYLGCGKLYPEHPEALVWDDLETHRDLIARLEEEYPDGWVLSLHSPSLRSILPLCPEDVRVGAWVKPFVSFKKGVDPAYAWEPVIFRGGRSAAQRGTDPVPGGGRVTTRDYLSEPIALRRGLPGAKPEAFCQWVLVLLGFDHERDTLDDLFPGTGIMSRVLAQLSFFCCEDQ